SSRTPPPPLPLSFPTRRSSDLVLHSFLWPGNIRQLENALQYAVLVSSGPELLKEHLPVCVLQAAFAPRSLREPVTCGGTSHETRSEEHTSELQSLTNLVCRLLL